MGFEPTTSGIRDHVLTTRQQELVIEFKSNRGFYIHIHINVVVLYDLRDFHFHKVR